MFEYSCDNLNYVATLTCEIRKFTITAKPLFLKEKLIRLQPESEQGSEHVNQYVNKCSNVQNECSNCSPPAATQAVSRLRHSLIALSITTWSRRSHSSSTRWRSSSTSVIRWCLYPRFCRIPHTA